MKLKTKKNSLVDYTHAYVVAIFLFIYVDTIFLHAIGYQKSDDFYHYYYMWVIAILGSFNILLASSLYKRLLLIYFLNKLYEFLVKHYVLAITILLIIPFIWIVFLQDF